MSNRHRIKVIDSPRKPFEGTSAREVHQKLGIGLPCAACRRPGDVKALVYALLSDLKPEQLAAVRAMWAKRRRFDGEMPTVELRGGPAVLLSETAACNGCKREFLRALAKGPSWLFVDVIEAPHAIQVGAVSVAVPS